MSDLPEEDQVHPEWFDEETVHEQLVWTQHELVVAEHDRDEFAMERLELSLKCAAHKDKADALVVALQDFETFGCRHDTNPTMTGEDWSVLEWYDYCRSMDLSVRRRASEALKLTKKYDP